MPRCWDVLGGEDLFLKTWAWVEVFRVLAGGTLFLGQRGGEFLGKKVKEGCEQSNLVYSDMSGVSLTPSCSWETGHIEETKEEMWE